MSRNRFTDEFKHDAVAPSGKPVILISGPIYLTSLEEGGKWQNCHRLF